MPSCSLSAMVSLAFRCLTFQETSRSCRNHLWLQLLARNERRNMSLWSYWSRTKHIYHGLCSTLSTAAGLLRRVLDSSTPDQSWEPRCCFEFCSYSSQGEIQIIHLARTMSPGNNHSNSSPRWVQKQGLSGVLVPYPQEEEDSTLKRT